MELSLERGAIFTRGSGPLWGRLGASWDRLGAVLRRLVAVLGRLGAVLRRFVAVLTGKVAPGREMELSLERGATFTRGSGSGTRIGSGGTWIGSEVRTIYLAIEGLDLLYSSSHPRRPNHILSVPATASVINEVVAPTTSAINGWLPPPLLILTGG